ncbi:MAG TPA: hypothetical protein VGI74_23470 [Streptosporangiaceae bacterium]
MRRAVAFARSIADSKAIAANFNAIVDAYDDAGEDVLRCEVDHVDGTFNACAATSGRTTHHDEQAIPAAC